MASWKCSKCGYVEETKSQGPPEECPSCGEKCAFIDNTCYTPDCAQDGTDKRL